MKNQKNELATLSPKQSNAYTVVPEEFEISRPDEFSERYTPGHGQCGESEKEYDALLKKADAKGKSPLGSKRNPATEPSDAGKPHTEGMGE